MEKRTYAALISIKSILEKFNFDIFESKQLKFAMNTDEKYLVIQFEHYKIALKLNPYSYKIDYIYIDNCSESFLPHKIAHLLQYIEDNNNSEYTKLASTIKSSYDTTYKYHKKDKYVSIEMKLF